MREYLFALAIGGLNDNGLQETTPVTVRMFDPDLDWVSTKFLDLCLTSSTGFAT